MTLTLVSVENTYAVYEDQDGEETLLATPLPVFRHVTMWDDYDVQTAWLSMLFAHRKTHSWGSPDRVAFVETVRREVADSDEVDIVWCESCEEALKADEAETVEDGHACTSCFEDNYRSCDGCGNTVHYENTTYTLAEESICSRCLDYNYAYCEECDGYYYGSDEDEHRHGGCDCESPAQVFTMRNDGEAPLNQDERVTISLPAGVISSEGINSIARLIRDQAPQIDWNADYQSQRNVYEERAKWYNLADSLESELGGQWQTKAGNYTKRLSKLAHKSQGLKIAPAVLSQIGNIGRDNSDGDTYEIEVTRDLNQSAEDFYHEDSCWWQSYSEGRCSLKQNGGIGLRTFGGPYNEVRGRAWIMPLRLDENGELVATFDSLTPDAFVIFNGYGDLSGYVPARIVAHMAGMTYRKINFTNSPMYVNGDSGYLVASEEIATKYAERGRLNLHTDTHSSLYHREQSAKQAELVTV